VPLRSYDPQLAHAELERRPLDPKPRGGAVRPGEYPVAPLERRDDVAPVSLFEGISRGWRGEQDGVVVRLGEVADVVLGSENYEEDVSLGSVRALIIPVVAIPISLVGAAS